MNENDNPSFPNLPPDAPDFKPWEQRAAPGMGGGGSAAPSNAPERPEKYVRAVQDVSRRRLEEIVNEQTDLVHYARLDQHSPGQSDLDLQAASNEDVWKQFNAEQLYDTRRVTLDHFHVFEWFPLAPGKFHTPDAKQHRQLAAGYMDQSADGKYFYTPPGKMEMLEGGIGAVRLRPVRMDGDDYYFMTASSNGVCHEGFPVLVPRKFYGTLKQRILADGASPVVLRGEMRYAPKETVTFFETPREFPLLYLFVDELQTLDQPRSEVTQFAISVAVSFEGEFQGMRGEYVTYCTFDPARAQSFQDAVDWIQNFYVKTQYKGMVITDFDDVRPHFPDAVFGLAKLRSGKLDEQQIRAFLQAHGFDQNTGQPFFVQYNAYKEIIQGDKITVGNITDSSGIAIGREASANVN